MKAAVINIVLPFVVYAVEQNLKDQPIDWSKLPEELHDQADSLIDKFMAQFLN
jgi:hypothetical protein